MYEQFKGIVFEKEHLFFLRSIGREIGVKSPTALTKEKLIGEIKLIISGKKQPTFTKKGRPSIVMTKVNRE